MTDIEIKLPDLSRVALEPGDKILVRCPKPVTEFEANLLKRNVGAHFPGHDVIVAGGDVDLAVIRPSAQGPIMLTKRTPAGAAAYMADVLETALAAPAYEQKLRPAIAAAVVSLRMLADELAADEVAP